MLISKNPNIVEALLDSEYVLFDQEKYNYINLNSSASLIWELIKNPIKKESLLLKLIKEVDEDKEIIKSDLESFIKQASRKNIICLNE